MVNKPERKELHHRQIDLRFFERSDGLYEVEGRVVDRKFIRFGGSFRMKTRPPEPRFTTSRFGWSIDENLVVRVGKCNDDGHPFRRMPRGGRDPRTITRASHGTRLERACARTAGGRSLLHPHCGNSGAHGDYRLPGTGAAASCPNEGTGHRGIHAKIDSCFAYAAHREVVAKLWPHLRQPGGSSEQT